MKLTILPSDGAVYKDNVSYSNLDLSSAPGNVHALQWDGTTGWIEYVNESEFRKPPNESITVLPTWAQIALDKWNEMKAIEDAQPQPIGVTVP